MGRHVLRRGGRSDASGIDRPGTSWAGEDDSILSRAGDRPQLGTEGGAASEPRPALAACSSSAPRGRAQARLEGAENGNGKGGSEAPREAGEARAAEDHDLRPILGSAARRRLPEPGQGALGVAGDLASGRSDGPDAGKALAQAEARDELAPAWSPSARRRSRSRSAGRAGRRGGRRPPPCRPPERARSPSAPGGPGRRSRRGRPRRSPRRALRRPPAPRGRRSPRRRGLRCSGRRTVP